MSCPGCGFENPPGFKLCGECAGPLAAGARQVTEKERPLRDRDPRGYAARRDVR